MLVIARQLNEAIRIGDDWLVQIVLLNQNGVKLRVSGSEIGGRLNSEKTYGPLKCDQGIDIAPEIRIDVVDLRQHEGVMKVRLGITAPKEVSIHRKEVYDAIRRTQQ